MKTTAGLQGIEAAVQLEKQAARDENLPIAYERIPISTIQIELQKQSLEKWKREWKS